MEQQQRRPVAAADGAAATPRAGVGARDESRLTLEAQAARLAELEARVSQQAAELERLQRALARSSRAGASTASPSERARTPRAGSPGGARAGRRALLTRAAALAAGLAGAGAGVRGASAAPPSEPSAATGSPMIIGAQNVADLPGDVTLLRNGPAGPQSLVFEALNGSSLTPTSVPAGTRIALAGVDTAAAASGVQAMGVYGRAANGIGVSGEGLWPLRVVPGPPGVDIPVTDAAGNLARDGTLFYETGVGTQGDQLWVLLKGVWRCIIGTDSAGPLRLITPVRIIDTRGAPFGPIGFDGTTGTPIAAGPFPPGDVTRFFRVRGTSYGGNLIAYDATGILANVTIVQATAGGGFVSVYPGSAPAAPNTSTVNPSTPTTSNFTAVGFGPSGNIAIRSVGEQPRDIIVDVTGYYYE